MSISLIFLLSSLQGHRLLPQLVQRDALDVMHDAIWALRNTSELSMSTSYPANQIIHYAAARTTRIAVSDYFRSIKTKLNDLAPINVHVSEQ
jgi:hypothetical protein